MLHLNWSSVDVDSCMKWHWALMIESRMKRPHGVWLEARLMLMYPGRVEMRMMGSLLMGMWLMELRLMGMRLITIPRIVFMLLLAVMPVVMWTIIKSPHLTIVIPHKASVRVRWPGSCVSSISHGNRRRGRVR